MAGKLAEVSMHVVHSDFSTSSSDSFHDHIDKLRKKRGNAADDDGNQNEGISPFFALINEKALHGQGANRCGPALIEGGMHGLDWHSVFEWGQMNTDSVRMRNRWLGKVVTKTSCLLSAEIAKRTTSVTPVSTISDDKNADMGAQQETKSALSSPRDVNKHPVDIAPFLAKAGVQERAQPDTDRVEGVLTMGGTLLINPLHQSLSGGASSDTNTCARHEQQQSSVISLAQRRRQSNLSSGLLTNNNAVHFDYPFQRWPGNHFVNVALQRDLMQDGRIILQPSGPLAADALHRQLADFPQYIPDILSPGSHDEERGGRQQQQESDEEEA